MVGFVTPLRCQLAPRARSKNQGGSTRGYALPLAPRTRQEIKEIQPEESHAQRQEKWQDLASNLQHF